MSRLLFKRSSGAFRAVRGEIIKAIQRQLIYENHNPGLVDGVFGTGSEEALINWQKENFIEPSAVIDTETWAMLMDRNIPDIKLRALQVTAAFEGHGFGIAKGNFDGALLTWGIIGFTLKGGKLAKIINRINEEHPEILEKSFGGMTEILFEKINAERKEQESWSNSISRGENKYRLSPEWSRAFQKLGDFSEVQKIQVDEVNSYFKKALDDMNNFNLETELAFALCFDIAVQNGGVDDDEKEQIERNIKRDHPAAEMEIREIIANVVAENSFPKWVEDVRSRKLTTATGEGRVHGYKYRLADWGLGEYSISK